MGQNSPCVAFVAGREAAGGQRTCRLLLCWCIFVLVSHCCRLLRTIDIRTVFCTKKLWVKCSLNNNNNSQKEFQDVCITKLLLSQTLMNTLWLHLFLGARLFTRVVKILQKVSVQNSHQRQHEKGPSPLWDHLLSKTITSQTTSNLT